MPANAAQETTMIKSLATTIHQRLVNPTEEHFKQLDKQINNIHENIETNNKDLREELSGLSEKVLTIRKELNTLLALHKKTRIVAFIALTWTAINTYILVLS